MDSWKDECIVQYISIEYSNAISKEYILILKKALLHLLVQSVPPGVNIQLMVTAVLEFVHVIWRTVIFYIAVYMWCIWRLILLIDPYKCYCIVTILRNLTLSQLISWVCINDLILNNFRHIFWVKNWICCRSTKLQVLVLPMDWKYVANWFMFVN